MESRISPSALDLGFCPDRLGRIAPFFQHYLDDKKLAGLSIAIARGSEEVFRTSMGVKDWDMQDPIKDDTIFRIYSMTKPITSVGLMMLHERGAFRLSDPLADYLPEFSDMTIYLKGDTEALQTVPATKPILIRDLLTQTSGLTYDFMYQHPVDRLYRDKGIDAFRTRDMYLGDFTERLAQMPLLFEPGSRWNYSFATDVVGRLIEVLSGQPLDEYLDQHIFTPLGMTDTSFAVPEDKVSRFSSCYEIREGKVVKQDEPEGSVFVGHRTFLSGGGGLVSTVDDYLKFARMLLNGGELSGHRLLSPTTVDLMTINHLPDNKTIEQMGDSLFSEVTTQGSGFGLGFSVVQDQALTMSAVSAGSFAWGGAASTYFWVDPIEDIIGILMTQLIPSSSYPIRPQLQTLTYAAITE